MGFGEVPASLRARQGEAIQDVFAATALDRVAAYAARDDVLGKPGKISEQ